MKVENSSKCMYTRNTADIPLKWKDLRNADITPNRRYTRSVADIPKLTEIERKTYKEKYLNRIIYSKINRRYI